MIRKKAKNYQVLASHQPDFFPWMGYFYKIFQSDMFVFSDNVQYSKSGRHNYNLILTKNGAQRLTMPIHYHPINLNELEIAIEDNFIRKTLKTIQMAYSKAPHFDEAYPIIERLYLESPKHKNLASFNLECIFTFCDLFGLSGNMCERKFYLSSELDLKNRRDARIIEMCKLLKAKAYLSGTAAKDYHIEEDYQKNGIELIYSDYEPVIYPQVGRPQSTNMCSIDYVMNCGFELPRGWKRIEPTYVRDLHSQL